MVKGSHKLRSFEKQILSRKKFTYPEALRIFNALYEEAIRLGAFTNKDPLHGLDDTLRLAKILNPKTLHG